jgi:hypothetical protein
LRESERVIDEFISSRMIGSFGRCLLLRLAHDIFLGANVQSLEGSLGPL